MEISENQNKCGFYIEKKKRFCKMLAKPGKQFCIEHGIQQTLEGEQRAPCPFDPKHSCYLSKLQKHMKKCNSRPEKLPEYIIPKINIMDLEHQKEEDLKYPISSLSDEVLLKLIEKIEKVYCQESFNVESKILRHDIMSLELENKEIGMNTKKHMIQNSSLLKNMEEYGFLEDNTTYIEFGAGRGQLGFWISQAVENNKNCVLLLIDKASHRHKSDNKLKGVSPVSTLRIRADIGDIDLSKIPLLTEHKNKIVGVTKHLCGVATDLALRCIVNGKRNGLNLLGMTMAFCCHHRCSWSSFAGKKYLTDLGFVSDQFSALCSISSWATCGSGRSRSKFNISESVNDTEQVNDRYKRFGLSEKNREQIGRKCKMILNQARLKYVEEFGYDAKLIYYVEKEISPENVCLIAKLKNDKS